MKPPKIENATLGFSYTVTEEQIKDHQKRSIIEIFEWLEEMNKFLHAVQTPKERELMKTLKAKKFKN